MTSLIADSKNDFSQKRVQELVDNLEQIQKSKMKVKLPDEKIHDQAKQWFKRAGDFRGRDLFLPYVGSGAGWGPYVELIDGSVKLDLINGIGVHIFGHGHPVVLRAALLGALSDTVMQTNLEPNREYVELGERLVELASKKSQLKRAWLTTCGAMANENALKMARQKNTPARMIIAPDRSFAGRSTMMAEITDNSSYKQGLPEYKEILRIPFYSSKDSRRSELSIEKVRQYAVDFKGQIAAFYFEPFQGEGGFNYAPRDYFIPLFEECKKNSIAIWIDEVQTFMRTGELFCYETLDIGNYVDICTVAKTSQLGATLFTDEYAPKAGLISGTFAGGSSALAVGKAILDELTQNHYLGEGGKISKIHNEFLQMLERLSSGSCKEIISDINGLGLMIGLTPFDGNKDKVMSLIKTLFKNGLMAFSCGRDPYRLRFLLPANLSSEDINVAEQILEQSLLEIKDLNE